MKEFGYFLVAAGFLVGAFVTSLDVENVNWVMFGGAATAAVIGLVIYKRQVGALARLWRRGPSFPTRLRRPAS